jgi:N utilization substance protein A
MSREILEAVRQIEREKGIEDDVLVRALEDALLAAYKKTPGAPGTRPSSSTRAATSACGPSSFRQDVEERLMDEARERAITELEAAEAEKRRALPHPDHRTTTSSSTGRKCPRTRSSAPTSRPRTSAASPAQTAKQVILQRIREAEREMMYDEYVDRVTEVVTGIVQQAGDRNNVLVDLGKVEALLPRSEQVDGERYEQGSRIKAVITEVRSGRRARR